MSRSCHADTLRHRIARRLTLAMAALCSALGATPTAAQHQASTGLVVTLDMLRAEHGPSDAVALRFTLTNASGETLSVLKWDTPLDGVNADLFEVVRAGERARYLGRLVKRAPPGASDYLTLAPGESVSAVVDLGANYAMPSAGDYEVRLRASQLAVRSPAASGSDSIVGHTRLGVLSNVVVFRLTTGRPVPSPSALPATFSGCSAGEVTQLTTALAAAEALSLEAVSGLVVVQTSLRLRATRYTNWFGSYTGARWETVMRNFQNIYSALTSQTFSFDCSGLSCSPNSYAYVYPGSPYVVYLCNAFWPAPMSGTDSKPGTLIHEMSHFTVIAATDDYAYGQSACISLALSNPALSIANADSHQYFAESTSTFMWVPAHSRYVPAVAREHGGAW